MNSAPVERKIALVTGASTGIGRATAEKLLQAGYFVILTARSSSLPRFDRMEFLRDPSRFWIRPLDVAAAIVRVAQMARPPLRLKVTLDAQVFGFLKKFLPDAVFARLVSYCLDKITNAGPVTSNSTRPFPTLLKP